MTRAKLVSFSGLLAFVWGAAGCESIVSRPGTQCASTQECRARGGEFSTSRCSSEGFCEAIVAPDAGSAVGSGCTASSECRDRLGGPARCVESSCYPLLTSDNGCSLIGAVENDDVVLLGAIVPNGGPAANEYRRTHDALRWLVSEWNGKVQTVLARNVAVVECDEGRLATTLPHLMDLRPKAIIGPFTNVAFREFLKTDAIETPTFAPTVDDVLLVEQPDSRRRVQSCTPNASTMTKSFQRAISLLAGRAAASHGVDEPKVVMVQTTDPADVEAAGKIIDGLTIGGSPAGDRFETVSVTKDILSAEPTPLLAQAQTIALKRPDLVVVTAPVVAEEIITSIDLRWGPLNGENVPRPLFLIGGRWSSLEDSFKNTNKETRGRFFAIDWALDPAARANYDVFAGEMIAQNSKGGFGSARAADCAFAALYGTFAAASKDNVSMLSVNAQQILDGLTIATRGEEAVNLTPDGIPRAVSFLGATPPLQTKLVGMSTPVVRFEANGTIAGTPALYCVTGENSSTPRIWAETGVTFDVATGVDDGTISCP